MNDDMPADREAWFKAVEIAAQEGLNAESEANRARDLYVLLTTGRTAYER